MKIEHVAFAITTEDPERLVAFYRDTVGLSPRPELGPRALDLDGAVLRVQGHSETHGASKEPTRFMLNLFVDDAKAERLRLEGAGVRFIRSEGREEWGGVISTFADPDGNYAQFIQYNQP